jgi:protein-S-isoprenylcysteine O-methyltransferase Ste14
MESGLWNKMLGRMLVVMYFSIFNILSSVFLLSRISKEDIALRNQFGMKWDNWAMRVPYSIFPGIY